jgi:hypothetical protein
MEVNIELAKKLLKEKYFINSDNGIRTQHPIRVEDLAFIMQKYTDQQFAIHSVVVPKDTLCDETESNRQNSSIATYTEGSKPENYA